MATFKLGTTSGSLILMPPPYNTSGFPDDFIFSVVEKKTVYGDLNVTYTGRVKKVVELQFRQRTKTEFETILAYCNTPSEFWVEIKDDVGTKYFDTYAYLMVEKNQKSTYGDGFKYDFSVKIKEL